jgi:cell division septal protein FtsQ
VPTPIGALDEVVDRELAAAGRYPAAHRVAGRHGLAVAAAIAVAAAAILMPLTLAVWWRPALTHFDAFAGRAGLAITSVKINGNRMTPEGDIRDGLSQAVGNTLLTLDAAAAEARIERLAWVERAVVRARWPSSIEVRLKERTARAVWRAHDRERLIDASGRTLGLVRPGSYPELPLIIADAIGPAATELIGVLADYPDLELRLARAELIDGGNWLIALANGAQLELPAAELAGAVRLVVESGLMSHAGAGRHVAVRGGPAGMRVVEVSADGAPP